MTRPQLPPRTLLSLLLMAALGTLGVPQADSHAATVFHTTTGNGADAESGRMIAEGSQLRWEQGDPAENGWMLFDARAGTVLAVMPAEQQLLDLTGLLSGSASSPAAHALKQSGAGGEVAGMKTREFVYVAAGKTCGTLALSSEALKLDGADTVLALFGRLSPDRADFGVLQDVMGDKANDPCDQPPASLSAELRSHGLPLAARDADGQTEFLVTAIETQVKLPADTYTVPAGYTRLDAAAQMQQAMQGLQEALQGMSPEERAMLQQMMQGQSH